MTIEQLVKELRKISKYDDAELAHIDADELLLKYINNEKVTKAFYSIEKWYA